MVFQKPTGDISHALSILYTIIGCALLTAELLNWLCLFNMKIGLLSAYMSLIYVTWFVKYTACRNSSDKMGLCSTDDSNHWVSRLSTKVCMPINELGLDCSLKVIDSHQLFWLDLICHLNCLFPLCPGCELKRRWHLVLGTTGDLCPLWVYSVVTERRLFLHKQSLAEYIWFWHVLKFSQINFQIHTLYRNKWVSSEWLGSILEGGEAAIHPERIWSRAASPSCQKEPTEVVQVSD